MKLFFLGDFKSDTGPGIANKLLKKGFSNIENVKFSYSNLLIMRILEIIINTIRFDKICICSFSKINYIAIFLAKLFQKEIFYIMHGCASYENSINNIVQNKKEIKKINKLEKYIIKNSKKVFCVSKKFMEFMVDRELNYSSKFDYIYNGIDIDEIEKITSLYKEKKIKNQIVSIGGGMRQKNNLTVCKAIDILNSKYGMNLKYVIIGLPYTDKNEICKYDFVEYYDYLPHDKVLQILGQSILYIQNSIFETFGLSIVEALFSGCNLLISNNIGVIDLINNLEGNDVIYNTMDVDEIVCKIRYILNNNNSIRISRNIKRDEISPNKTSKMLYQKIILNNG